MGVGGTRISSISIRATKGRQGGCGGKKMGLTSRDPAPSLFPSHPPPPPHGHKAVFSFLYIRRLLDQFLRQRVSWLKNNVTLGRCWYGPTPIHTNPVECFYTFCLNTCRPRLEISWLPRAAFSILKQVWPWGQSCLCCTMRPCLSLRAYRPVYILHGLMEKSMLNIHSNSIY